MEKKKSFMFYTKSDAKYTEKNVLSWEADPIIENLPAASSSEKIAPERFT